VLTIYFVIIIIYFLLSIVFTRAINKKNVHSFRGLPPVSIIIAARNEEKVIADCLASLSQIEYPENLLEIILVNDRSTDSTEKIMKNFSVEFKNVKIISVKENKSNLSGKSNALSLGASAASGDILFFTDADCKVPPGWVSAMVKEFSDNNTIVSGFLFLDKQKEKNFSSLFCRVQSLDWILFCSTGMALSNMRHPLSIFGNNFAVSKKLFVEIGGFSEVGYHPTEDYAFMRKAVKEKDAKVIFSLSLDSGVFTRPASRLKDFISQRKRWALGTKRRDFISLSLLFLSIATLWSSLFLLGIGKIVQGLFGLSLIIISDIIILQKPLYVLKKRYLFRDIVFYELFFAIYTLFLLPLSLIKSEISWKGERIN